MALDPRKTIDGALRSFSRPRFLTAQASGNSATLSTTLTRLARIRSQDEIIAHKLLVNYLFSYKAGVTGSVDVAVTVGNDSQTVSINTGSGNIGATLGDGNSGVVFALSLPVLVGGSTDIAVGGNQEIDLRQGNFTAGTSWSIFLAGNPGNIMIANVSITLVYNSISELLP